MYYRKFDFERHYKNGLNSGAKYQAKSFETKFTIDKFQGILPMRVILQIKH